ncbi:DUF4259 domain-containing protein [Kitasatospora sp. NPDC058170]|uniref:DUF4259 domain-containing protein n=1 Tax=Kitasatospora sp. NPDC058170 TaxID=3346364 RepID=UPI0036DC60FC
MGTWGIGPFDSDHAEQFGDEVDHALPDERHTVIEARLTRYLAGGQGYHLRDEAIAAAFLVAAQYPGGADAVSSGYRPKQPIPDLPQHLRPMAARALDRVLGDVQFDMDAWNRAGQREVGEQWLDGLKRLRTVLDPDTPYTVAYTPGPLLRHEIGTGRALRDLGVDRLRALPGYGDDGAAGQLVQRIVEAARSWTRRTRTCRPPRTSRSRPWTPCAASSTLWRSAPAASSTRATFPPIRSPRRSARPWPNVPTATAT